MRKAKLQKRDLSKTLPGPDRACWSLLATLRFASLKKTVHVKPSAPEAFAGLFCVSLGVQPVIRAHITCENSDLRGWLLGHFGGQ